MSEQQFFKVLRDGQSIHGGDLKWSLPVKRGTGWQPGKWHEVEGEITVCSNGLHLTTAPHQQWYEWGCTVYEAQGEGDSDSEGDDKTAFRRARLLRPAPEPEWLVKTKALIASIQSIQWFQPQGEPKPEWRVYETWDAARNAAGDAARNAAWDAAGNAARNAAWAAAWDAQLMAQIQGICADLEIPEPHRQHVAARWEVWQMGYSLFCDVNGVLYVYKKVV